MELKLWKNIKFRENGPLGYKTFFMLNSTKIYHAHKF